MPLIYVWSEVPECCGKCQEYEEGKRCRLLHEEAPKGFRASRARLKGCLARTPGCMNCQEGHPLGAAKGRKASILCMYLMENKRLNAPACPNWKPRLPAGVRAAIAKQTEDLEAPRPRRGRK